MAATKQRLKGRPSHREDLRAELIDAGREYIAENGHANLSMRVLAEHVGVSSGAPYHHFPDRRSLLLAVATEGYNLLMSRAIELKQSRLPSREKLRLMGLQFLQFADENPKLFQLMYESELSSPTADALLDLQRIGFEALRSAIVEAQPALEDEEVDVRVSAFWSAVYGFTTLRNKAMIQAYQPGTLATTEFAERVVGRAAEAALVP